jgi:hypothetical protein
LERLQYLPVNFLEVNRVGSLDRWNRQEVGERRDT